LTSQKGEGTKRGGTNGQGKKGEGEKQKRKNCLNGTRFADIEM